MHDLVESASHALSKQDAEWLEELVAEARKRSGSAVAINYAELSRAATVLTAQVMAASSHLRLRTDKPDEANAYRGTPWDR